jgi:hypothetical protein
LQIKTYFYNEKKPPTLTCMNKKSFMFWRCFYYS